MRIMGVLILRGAFFIYEQCVDSFLFFLVLGLALLGKAIRRTQAAARCAWSPLGSTLQTVGSAGPNFTVNERPATVPWVEVYMAINRGLRAAMLHGALCGLMAVSVAGFSQQNPAPDNSKTNQQDQNKDRPTADQQRENDTDRQLTKQIRQAILEDKSLSTYAHNVKIIAQDGQVTLRGPVRSKEEKRIVESKAAEIAGDGKVTSELQVAPQKD
jgi:hyperosmotically inducible periplasmic protein